jgi:starch phosphorylase
MLRHGEGPLKLAKAATARPARADAWLCRRFATYKRATLLFRDEERLKRILNNPERPVQIVFSARRTRRRTGQGLDSAHLQDEP